MKLKIFLDYKVFEDCSEEKLWEAAKFIEEVTEFKTLAVDCSDLSITAEIALDNNFYTEIDLLSEIRWVHFWQEEN